MMAVEDLDEIDIGPLREGGMAAVPGPAAGDIHGRDLCAEEDIVGHAGIDIPPCAQLHVIPGHIQPEVESTRRDESCGHVPPLHPGPVNAAADFEREFIPPDAELAGEPGNRPAAVAAHPGEAAVGIDMDIVEIGAAALLEQDDAVRSDAAAVLADGAEKGGILPGRPDPAAVVDQDEIIPGR